MDGIDLLKRDALVRRNAKILAAKREYHNELKAIKQLGRRLGVCLPGRPRKAVVTEDASLKATTVAKQILMEGKRMTLAELTAEVQRRGCRSADDYRAVAHAINSGLSHYRRHFKRDREGRWVVLAKRPTSHSSRRHSMGRGVRGMRKPRRAFRSKRSDVPSRNKQGIRYKSRKSDLPAIYCCTNRIR